MLQDIMRSDSGEVDELHKIEEYEYNKLLALSDEED